MHLFDSPSLAAFPWVKYINYKANPQQIQMKVLNITPTHMIYVMTLRTIPSGNLLHSY